MHKELEKVKKKRQMNKEVNKNIVKIELNQNLPFFP